MMRALLALALLLVAPVLAARCADADWPSSFRAQVVMVKDGDTLVIRNPGFASGPRERSVRLHGVDAPEFDQPYGQDARIWLKRQLHRRWVSIESVASDRYCRLLAHVHSDGVWINQALIAAGLAWHEARDTTLELARAQLEAQRVRRGLWADPDPIPPAIWRKQQRAAGVARRTG